MSNNNRTYERLESLDILRGLDLFLLVFFQPIFTQLAGKFAPDSMISTISNALFTHAEWEGYHLWDHIMPLFLFMTGTSIPYAFSKFKRGEASSGKMFRRIIKRVVLLCIFGAIVQGNLLDLDMSRLYIYTDTLQSIAMGYLFASIIYMYLPIRAVFVTAVLLPVIYTIGMQIHGGYAPGDNLAEMIDRAVLGNFVNGSSVGQSGEIIFADWYHYAWIFPTLNFTATVLSGVLTGYALKSTRMAKDKLNILLIAGIVCIAIGLGLSDFEPIIKHLWTSSMTFFSSGISILLMAFSYYIIDVNDSKKSLDWLKIYGMNSILAYMLFNTLWIDSLLSYWLHGFQPYLNEFYSVLMVAARIAVIFLILRYCYKKRIFLKV